MNRITISFLLLFIAPVLYAQTPDLATINSYYIGPGTGVAESKISFSRTDFSINLPQKLEEKRFLIHNVQYANITIDYDIDLSAIYQTELEHFSLLSYRLTYVNFKPSKMPYILLFAPTLASNFQGKVSFKDIRFFGMLSFIKQYSKTRKLTYGVLYSNSLGFPAPIPIVSYHVEPLKNLTLDIGFPQMKVNYKADQLNSYAWGLMLTGENLVLGHDLQLSTKTPAMNTVKTPIDNIRILNIGSMFEWNRKLGTYAKFVAGVGYTFTRKFSFNEGSKKRRQFELQNNLAIHIGLKFGMYK